MLKSSVPFLALLLLVSASLHAATIDVRVDRGASAAPLTIQLGIADADREPRWIASQPAGSEPVRFDALPAGAYVLALTGAAPTERLTQKVNLGESDERHYRLTVPTRTLHARVTMGGKPLGGVSVTLTQQTWNWTATLTTDRDGNVRAPLWDEGEFLADLRGGPLTAPVKMLTNLDGNADVELAVSNRHIRGRVVDEHGKPIANAKVLLRAERPGLKAILAVLTNANGAFDYPGIEPGHHTLRINRDGYLIADEAGIDVKNADVEKKITLAQGIARELEVVDAHRNPVKHAVVLASAGGRVRALANSDDAGRVRIATPKDGDCAIWVLPEDGSLAAYRLDEHTTSVVVPEATASLDVQTLLSDGTPLSNVSFVLRYNGELAPADVARMLARGGNRLSTNADGVAQLARIPAGTYELWPYVSDAEAEALVASAAPERAPVSVNVTTGRQTAVVRFEKSH